MLIKKRRKVKANVMVTREKRIILHKRYLVNASEQLSNNYKDVRQGRYRQYNFRYF